MKSKSILVVEDDEDVRLDLADKLAKSGHTVFAASDGTGAIQRLLDNPGIEVIVTDIRMPVFGGDYWLSFLKRFCLPRYKIILATARPLTQSPDGMHLLRKPYSFQELEKLL